MKKEYDFSKGERGKYARPNAAYHVPVYLEDDLQEALQSSADKQHVELTVLVNTLLRNTLPAVRS